MIYNYSTKPQGKFRAKVKGSTSPIDTEGKTRAKANVFYIGTENETRKTRNNPSIDYRELDHKLEATCSEVYNKTDCSIDDAHGVGLEIITHPCTIGYWFSSNLAERICQTTKECGFNGDHSSCGYHVHISKSPFIAKGMDIRKIEASFVLGFERFWDEFSKLSARRSNRYGSNPFAYCARTNKGTMAEALEFVDWQKRSHNNRYFCINVQNEHTIEVRLWSGTSDPQRIKAYISLTYGVATFLLNGGDAETCTFKEFINYDHLPSESAKWMHNCGLV